VLGLVYCEQELGATGYQLGLYYFCAAILEAPFFIVAPRVTVFLGGPIWTIIIINWLGFVRYAIGYYRATSFWTMLPFELTHTLHSALYFTVMTEYCEACHTDGLQATAFGLVGSCFTGGMMAASLASTLTAVTGFRSFFLYAGCFFAVLALPSLVLLISRKERPVEIR